MVIRCCVCYSVCIDGKWQKKEVTDGQKISHSYCPHCLKVEKAALVAARKRELAVT